MSCLVMKWQRFLGSRSLHVLRPSFELVFWWQVRARLRLPLDISASKPTTRIPEGIIMGQESRRASLELYPNLVTLFLHYYAFGATLMPNESAVLTQS